jgi:hypothetical protein
LDWIDYGKNVDLKGRDIPWGDSTRLVNFIGQGRTLLNLGVVSIDLGDYFVWWLREIPSVLGAMGWTSMAPEQRIWALSILLSAKSGAAPGSSPTHCLRISGQRETATAARWFSAAYRLTRCWKKSWKYWVKQATDVVISCCQLRKCLMGFTVYLGTSGTSCYHLQHATFPS